MKGRLAQLYRALRPLGLFPPVIREMYVWECAVLLGEDEPARARLSPQDIPRLDDLRARRANGATPPRLLGVN